MTGLKVPTTAHSMSFPHCYHGEPLRASQPGYVVVRCCGRYDTEDQHPPHTREVRSTSLEPSAQKKSQ